MMHKTVTYSLTDSGHLKHWTITFLRWTILHAFRTLSLVHLDFFLLSTFRIVCSEVSFE